MKQKSKTLLRFLLIILLLYGTPWVPIFGQSLESPKKVLMLYSDTPFLPANAIMDQAVQKTLKSPGVPPVTFYSEYLDVNRFKSPEIQDAVRELLLKKYAGQSLDLVMVMDDIVWDYVTTYGDQLFPGTPVVFCSITEGKVDPSTLKPNVTGNFKHLDVEQSIENILKVQPEVKEIVVVTGGSAQDLQYKATAMAVLDTYRDRVKVRILEGLGFDEVQKALGQLPSNLQTAVFFVSFNMDGKGKTFIPREVIPILSKVSTAPIYGMYDTFLGKGILGGNMISYGDIGENAAQIAAQILKGIKPSDIKASTSPNKNYFDWNEMKRWGINDSVLPKGSIVVNEVPSLWEQYQWQIIGILVFLLVETMMLFFLVVERRLKSKAEQSLKVLNERLENILEGTYVGTWEWKVQTGEVTFNRRWAQMLGYTLEELAPVSIQTWIDLAHPEDLALSDEHLQRNFSRELDYYSAECRMRHKNGHWIWVLDRGKVVSWDAEGKPILMSGTHSDITESKLAELATINAKEAAEAANAAKSQFLANMSHEIRTPLNGIMGTLQLLETTEQSEEQQEYTRISKASSDALLVVINDILDYSKIEAGKVALEDTNFDISQIIKDVFSLFRLSASNKNIALEMSIHQDVPAVLRGDPFRLRQVLSNLVGNAVKFTPEGNIHVNVERLLDTPDGGLMLEIQVRDTGIGISEDKMGVLFQRFSQADGSNTRQYGGTGLGLAICKGLVELMGGSVRVDSQVGKGSTFCVTCRLQEAEAGAEVAMMEGISARRPAGDETVHIMLVEDDPTARTMIGALAKRHGWEISYAENGLEAVELFKRHVFDVILMDVQMPVMDGYTAAEIIRQTESTRFTPIIALTAHVMKEDYDRCMKAGMNDYLAKPVDINGLSSLVQKWTISRRLPSRQLN